MRELADYGGCQGENTQLQSVFPAAKARCALCQLLGVVFPSRSFLNQAWEERCRDESGHETECYHNGNDITFHDIYP
jgi:hypothetical protein